MAYPGVDVAGELGKARAWCLSNPRKRKTRNGIRRFLNGWMDKAQNNASRASPAIFWAASDGKAGGSEGTRRLGKTYSGF